MRNYIIILFCLFGVLNLLHSQTYKVQSPGKTLQIEVSAGNELTWKLYHNGKMIMGPSVISMTLDKEGLLGKNARVRKVNQQTVNNVI